MLVKEEDFRKRVIGAVLGLAAGDALGVPAEFLSREDLRREPVRGMRGGGVHGQPAGTWSDDTSMTLCVMDSLTEKGVDPDDQMQRFARWLWKAENTARGEVFDVGGTCRRAIFNCFRGTSAPECGETAEFSCGNGSLMRMAPLAFWLVGQTPGLCRLDERTAEIIHGASRLTHAHPRCLMACGIYCSAVFAAFCCETKEEAVSCGVGEALRYYRGRTAFREVYDGFLPLRRVAERSEEELRSTGYVVDTLEAALWCFLKGGGYADCLLRAVNLGGDADTVAAVAGSLAGAWYGEREIPPDWQATTVKYEELRRRAERFSCACLEHPEKK